MRKIKIYDTTLRDGTQGEGINFSATDKVLIAEKLDSLGVHYIEGGWPGSNPKDIEFFKKIRHAKLKNAKVAAFGSTRRTKTDVAKDENLKKLLEAETPVVTIFGKSWTFHVFEILRTTEEENLKMIQESVRYLKHHKKEVVYDAEHFFDGYKDDPSYALKTIEAAAGAGADWIVLCDTNGGSLPAEVSEITKLVRQKIETPLGIHVHDDGGLAVANSLAAVEAGADQVQGTMNGYGERCGNANLCTLIPNLKFKMKLDCLPDKSIASLTEVSRFVDELANIRHNTKLPFVGQSAFAHKGGMHVNAVEKNPRSFEHIAPELVGNIRRVLVSELAGRSNVSMKAREVGIHLQASPEKVGEIVEQLKVLENAGYEFEAAEGSFELLVKKVLKKHKKFFELAGFRVIVEKDQEGRLFSEATVKVRVGDKMNHTAAEGVGPVNALDSALRKALEKFYPQISQIKLADFKVRVLETKEGTAAKVRVLIESSDDGHIWSTVGVSENIIEASWQALVDSVEYKLLKDEETGK